MIKVNGLTKHYGAKQAVNHINFEIEEGEIVGFLGPNGAGKSTTMNMLTGYLSMSEGSVTIGGMDITQEPKKTRALVGYLPEQPPLYLDMTVEEYLQFVFNLKKVKLDRQSHIQEVCSMADIQAVRGRMIRNLSKGYKQRVGLAGALIGNPKVLILDEPTVGLDPKQIIEIRNVIRELGRSRTVILSSHILPEIQAVCSRVLVISHGEIVADGTPETLSDRLTGRRRLQLSIEGLPEKTEAVLRRVSGVTDVSVQSSSGNQADFIVDAENETDVRRGIFDALASEGLAILSMQAMDLNLEDIFLKLTEEQDAASAPLDGFDEMENLDAPTENSAESSETQEENDDDGDLEA